MGANGFELCSDDNTNPDGRIIVAFDKQYMSVDGDKSNGDSDGFVRLDSTGPTCGDDKHTDSSAGPGSSCTASMSRPGGLPADLAGLSLGIMHLVG
jgi:hypothetical protein